METRASYIAVGAFVLAMILAFAVFIIWISKQGQEDFARYDILFPGSVTGLQIDSRVRYRGIIVGRVQNIAIDAHDISQIRVTIEVKRGTPIRQDTVATLGLEGITGGAYILLTGSMQDSVPLKETMEGPYPIIKSAPSPLEKLFEGAPNLVANTNVLVDRATQMLSTENVQRVTDILENTRVATASLARNADKIDALLSNGAETAEQLRAASVQIEGLARDLRRDTKSISTEILALSQELRNTNQTVGKAAGEIEGLVAENRGPIREFTSGGLFELSQLVTDLRLLTASLSRISAQIERDPARFLFGDRQKGFEAK